MRPKVEKESKESYLTQTALLVPSVKNITVISPVYSHLNLNGL